MKPHRSAAVAFCALLSVFLTACGNTESIQTEAAHPKDLQGVWKEVRPVNVAWFDGSGLVLTFDPDSVSILESRFTDVSTCTDTGGVRLCSNFAWENTYQGTWQADDSLLTVSFRFAATTANHQTEESRMPDGTYRMRYVFSGPGVMTLRAMSGEEPLPYRDSLELSLE